MQSPLGAHAGRPRQGQAHPTPLLLPLLTALAALALASLGSPSPCLGFPLSSFPVGGSPLSDVPLPKSRSVVLGFLGATNLYVLPAPPGAPPQSNSNTLAGGAPALFAARLAVNHL